MRVVNLVQQAHELLDRFLKVDAQDSQGASEMVVELQELVDELRVLRPLAFSVAKNKTRLALVNWELPRDSSGEPLAPPLLR